MFIFILNGNYNSYYIMPANKLKDNIIFLFNLTFCTFCTKNNYLYILEL